MAREAPSPQPPPASGGGSQTGLHPLPLAGEGRVRVVRARELRQHQTDAEALLWHHLRSRKMLGLKFRRQRAIGPYFADFACLEAGLVIELDGGQHNEDSALAYDHQRESFLRRAGFTTLRFWNHEVLTQTESVLEKILQTLTALTPTLSRERERE